MILIILNKTRIVLILFNAHFTEKNSRRYKILENIVYIFSFILRHTINESIERGEEINGERRGKGKEREREMCVLFKCVHI